MPIKYDNLKMPEHPAKQYLKLRPIDSLHINVLDYHVNVSSKPNYPSYLYNAWLAYLKICDSNRDKQISADTLLYKNFVAHYKNYLNLRNPKFVFDPLNTGWLSFDTVILIPNYFFFLFSPSKPYSHERPKELPYGIHFCQNTRSFFAELPDINGRLSPFIEHPNLLIVCEASKQKVRTIFYRELQLVKPKLHHEHYKATVTAIHTYDPTIGVPEDADIFGVFMPKGYLEKSFAEAIQGYDPRVTEQPHKLLEEDVQENLDFIQGRQEELEGTYANLIARISPASV